MPGKDDPALTKNADSGGAHSKGYSAESCPPPPELDNDPLPLAKDSDVMGHVHRRDEDAVVPLTGGEAPSTYPRNHSAIASG
jgi:hypothetical protein